MQILTISLNLQLPAWEIPNLRAAIAERVGLEYELFHMHNNNPDEQWQYHNHYPLIQYSLDRGFVQIQGINAGAEALRCILLPKLTEDWIIGGRKIKIPAYQVRHQERSLSITDQPQTFRLYNWVALNKENYLLWDACRGDEAAQLNILSKALTGHLRSFAEGMEFKYYKGIEARVTRLFKKKKVRWHGTQLMTFEIEAESDFQLPHRIGIGRLSAYGFGRTDKVKVAQARQNQTARQKQSRNA